MTFARALFALLAFMAMVPANAQERDVPYWATIRFDEVNMRVGPSQEYKIEWVYHRRGLPVKVVRVREGWRLVRDHEGTQGWIASSQLHPDRGAMVVGEGLADIRESASGSSALKWRAEPRVVGNLADCEDAWCEVDIAGHKGWMRAERLWGVGAP